MNNIYTGIKKYLTENLKIPNKFADSLLSDKNQFTIQNIKPIVAPKRMVVKDTTILDDGTVVNTETGEIIE